MANVAFWATVHGQASTTTNAMAVAHFSSLDQEYKTLITQTHYSHSTLERTLLQRDFSQGKTIFNDTGIDSLERLARTDRLTPSCVPDYTDSILKDRLDLLIGTTKKDMSMFHNIQDVISIIMQAAKKEYDMSLFDINSGTKNELSKTILQQSDVIVVNLNQNVHVLDRFFNRDDYLDALDLKPYVIVISQYDPKSRMSLRAIRRRYKVKQPIFAIPYCTQYRDAINDKKVTEFFLRAQNFGPKSDDYLFTKHIKDLVQGIIKVVKEIETSERGVS